jgi:hypothetical protein
MQIRWMVSMVLVLSLLAGACTRRDKPVGYVVGAGLTIGGGLLVHDFGQQKQCNGCIFPDKLEEGALGAAMVLTGLTVLIVTLMSPFEPPPRSSPKVVPPLAASSTALEEHPDPDRPRVLQLAPRGPAHAGVRLGFD